MTEHLIVKINAKTVSLLVMCVWFVFLLFLLLLNDSPQIPGWLGPPHFTSSVIMAIVAAATISGWRNHKDQQIVWYTLIISTTSVVALEIIQLTNPARSFDVQDIIDGVAGVAVGSMFVAFILKMLSQKFLMPMSVVLILCCLLGTPMLFERVDSCGQPTPVANDWSKLQVLVPVLANDSSPGDFAKVCAFDGPVKEIDKGIDFNHGGVRSASLSGLSDAIRRSGQLTFGIEFSPVSTEFTDLPRHIGSLAIGGEAKYYLARAYHNGTRASASVRLNRFEHSNSTVANRISEGRQSIVIAHDGVKMQQWVNGQLTNIVFTPMDLTELRDGELVLTLGRRSDGRWLPYMGQINQVVIGAQAVSGSSVSELFLN